MNYKDITNIDHAFVVKELNHKPRKWLNYQTPYDVIYNAIHGAHAILIHLLPISVIINIC